MHGQVGEGVVDLGVDNVHQRGYLRELVLERVQESLQLVGAVFTDHDYHHYFAGRGNSHHHSAEEAFLGAEVVERQSVAYGVVLHEVAHAVRDVVLKVAAADVEHLVEGTGDVEACGVSVGEFLAAVKLLESEPAAVRESVFHFVAVLPYIVAAKRIGDRRQLYLGDAFERVDHLLPFASELILVGEVLPAATTAYGEVLASRLLTDVGGLYHSGYAALRV